MPFMRRFVGGVPYDHAGVVGALVNPVRKLRLDLFNLHSPEFRLSFCEFRDGRTLSEWPLSVSFGLHCPAGSYIHLNCPESLS